MGMRRVLFAVLYLAGAWSPVLTQAEVTRRDSPDGQGQIHVSMKVTPVAPRAPVLKYRLLPPLVDRRSGNAATMYNKAALVFAETNTEEFYSKYGQFENTSLEKLPVAEVKALLASRRTILELLDQAARREHCDWGLPYHEQINLIELVLPEMQKMRDHARLASLRARAELAEGKYDDAARSLQTMFAMARHTGDEPLLVNGLIGVAIGSVALSMPIEDWIGQPDSPNLYWSLAALPRPMFNLSRALESESDLLFLGHRHLQNLRTRVYSNDEMNALIDGMTHDLEIAVAKDNLATRVGFAALIAASYPNSKRRLIEQGVPVPMVEAMPVAQVVLADSLRIYEEQRDDSFCWMSLPYWQAERGIRAAEARWNNNKSSLEPLPISRILLPAVGSACQAFARLDRQIAQHMAIEAIRAYGATHDGQLPSRLDDIVDLPVPRDPMTDLPFDYERAGDVATLKPPVRSGVKTEIGRYCFEIRFVK